MKNEVRKNLHAAFEKGEWVAIFLISTGECIKGNVTASNDPERIKIITNTGPVWVPIKDVKSVSRVLKF